MSINRPIQQAPWRTHRQRVGAVLLAIVGTSMVAALYLSVASQATLAGREIQTLEREISLAREENANLKTELARLLSHHATETRSNALGFRPASVEETHYISVPGYEGRQPVTLAANAALSANNTLLPAEYSQSLFDWFELQMQRGILR